MKPEEQRIAIAEACGSHQVSRLSFDGGTITHITDENGRIRTIRQIDDGPRSETYPRDWIPLADYLNDLNAMHEAVETLRGKTGPEWFDFQRLLMIECGSWMNCIQARAAVRAEVFLKTLSLWKDDN